MCSSTKKRSPVSCWSPRKAAVRDRTGWGSESALILFPEAAEALTALAIYWDRWHQVWLERGFAPLRDAWLARAARLGERIRARFAHGETRGVFEGIDESGALILREHHGAARAIPAGEIYF
jgi:BirA family biotin operon repressor/biotin-[acetyl-CoA-carboxylase] ligase